MFRSGTLPRSPDLDKELLSGCQNLPNRVLPANAALRAQGYTLRKGANGEVILVRSGAAGR